MYVDTAAKGNNANNFDETMFTECGFMSFDDGGFVFRIAVRHQTAKHTARVMATYLSALAAPMMLPAEGFLTAPATCSNTESNEENNSL